MEVLLENGPKMMMHFCAAFRVSYIYISSHLRTSSFNTNSLLLFFFFLAQMSTLQRKANTFRRVLVDAPSSGVGVVCMATRARVCCTAKELSNISTQQKQLLLDGADCVKKSSLHDSYLVYTTCSVLVIQNSCFNTTLLSSKLCIGT